MESEKKQRTINLPPFIRKFGQFIYLSAQGCTNINLWENASACSFNFIFSFIPVVMIILTVLVTILRFSSGMLDYVMIFCKQVENIYDFWPLLENLMNKKSFSIFDFVLAVWVIWMARKLFLSIVRGIYSVFRTESPRKNIFNQLLTFVSEFVLVIVFILFIIITFLFDKLFQLPFFDILKSYFPFIFRNISNILISSVLYLMLFIFSLLSYKFISGTKPALRICAFYALLNTGITFLISFFLNKFMHFTNYNVIYGTISTVIILLFKVYLFFVVFLFCAQMVYVSQFFDTLLISQLYVMQHKKRTYGENLLSNYLFDTPSVSKIKTTTIHYQKDDIIYSINEHPDFVYYIAAGTVHEIRNNKTMTYTQGCFFGELSGFLNTKRDSSTTAEDYTEIIRFDTTSFTQIIRQNHLASAIALSKLTDFTKPEDSIT